MTSSSLQIHDGSTCRDVIIALLEQQRVTDDANLFYVVDRDSNGKNHVMSLFQINGME